MRAATDKPFGVDLLTALPDGIEAKVRQIADGGRQRLRRRARRAARRRRPAATSGNVLVVNMCGKVRHAIAAVEAGCDLVVAQGTEAGGHTGQIATMALVPQVVDAVGDRVPVVAAGGIFDGRGLGRGPVARRRRCVGRHPLHRHPRGAHRHRLQGGAARVGRGRHGRVSRAYTGKTCRVGPQRVDAALRGPPGGARAVPGAAASLRSRQGASHLGGDPTPTGVDPDRECYPAGQGVGAITELVPAGELVTPLRRRSRARALAKLG